MNKRNVAGIFAVLMACIVPAQAEEAGMTEKQKLSYALGMFFTQSISRQNLDLDQAYFLAAVEDVLNKKQPKLSMEEVQTILTAFQKQEQEKRTAASVRNSQAGREFLAENKTREGVVELNNGLQYKILRPGTGPSPTLDNEVTVHYRGTLINGTEFDSSYARSAPARLALNRVIKGWQQALPLMKTGAKWQLYIPAELAYGAAGQDAIGPDETLIFEVELVAVH